LMAELFPRFNAEESFIVSTLSQDARRRLAGALRSIARHLDTTGEERRASIAER
jgi:hypothetical protein